MRKYKKNSSDGAKRQTVDELKRRDLKRIAAALAVAFAVSTLVFASTGCQSTKNQREYDTLDGFLAGDKPSY